MFAPEEAPKKIDFPKLKIVVASDLQSNGDLNDKPPTFNFNKDTHSRQPSCSSYNVKNPLESSNS